MQLSIDVADRDTFIETIGRATSSKWPTPPEGDDTVFMYNNLQVDMRNLTVAAAQCSRVYVLQLGMQMSLANGGVAFLDWYNASQGVDEFWLGHGYNVRPPRDLEGYFEDKGSLRPSHYKIEQRRPQWPSFDLGLKVLYTRLSLPWKYDEESEDDNLDEDHEDDNSGSSSESNSSNKKIVQSLLHNRWNGFGLELVKRNVSQFFAQDFDDEPASSGLVTTERTAPVTIVSPTTQSNNDEYKGRPT